MVAGGELAQERVGVRVGDLEGLVAVDLALLVDEQQDGVEAVDVVRAGVVEVVQAMSGSSGHVRI